MEVETLQRYDLEIGGLVDFHQIRRIDKQLSHGRSPPPTSGSPRRYSVIVA
jgi:hypothetical protein